MSLFFEPDSRVLFLTIRGCIGFENEVKIKHYAPAFFNEVSSHTVYLMRREGIIIGGMPSPQSGDARQHVPQKNMKPRLLPQLIHINISITKSGKVHRLIAESKLKICVFFKGNTTYFGKFYN